MLSGQHSTFRYSKLGLPVYCLAFWSLSNNPLFKPCQEKYQFIFMSKAWPHQPYIDSADNALEISSADLALLIAADGDASFRWFAVFQSDPQQSLLLYHRPTPSLSTMGYILQCGGTMGVQLGTIEVQYILQCARARQDNRNNGESRTKSVVAQHTC